MDPVACWKNICQNVAYEHKWEDVFEEIDNLFNWLARGGFRPDNVPLPMDLDSFRFVLKMIHKQRQMHINPDL